MYILTIMCFNHEAISKWRGRMIFCMKPTFEQKTNIQDPFLACINVHGEDKDSLSPLLKAISNIVSLIHLITNITESRVMFTRDFFLFHKSCRFDKHPIVSTSLYCLLFPGLPTW
uniref:Uncharacterized protein n=1 Tax=Cacopsylla melanoneura TaxID=428564 RepID=A0A8D8QAN3_9HEMI